MGVALCVCVREGEKGSELRVGRVDGAVEGRVVE